MRYLHLRAHEQFRPDDLLRQAVAAERSGFDGIAYLRTRSERRPPIYVSAFGPRAARVAGRHGDGRWTLAIRRRSRSSSTPTAAPPRTRGASRARSSSGAVALMNNSDDDPLAAIGGYGSPCCPR